MPVFDQYEVEPISAYTGSYTDDININNPILNGTSSIAIYIGSKNTGLNENINLVNFTYLDRLDYVSGSKGGTVTQNLYSQGISNERYYDSIPPDLLSLYTLDAKIPSFGSTVANNSEYGFLSGSLIHNRPLIPQTNIPIIIGPIGSRNILSTNASSEFINFSWKENPWPYRSRYKNIARQSSFKNRLYRDIYSTTKSLDGNDIPQTLCTHIGSFYWALPVNDGPTGIIKSPVLFVTSGANDTNLFFEHGNMPAGEDLHDIIYNSSIGDAVSGSVKDLYVSVGRKFGMAYSFNGIKWFPLSGYLTNDKLIQTSNTSIGDAVGSFDTIAYSVDGIGGTPGRHRRYIIANTRVGTSGGGIYVQNVSKKIPYTDTPSDWTFYSNGNLATGSYISGLPASTQVNVKSIAFNDPYGYMNDGDGKFCMVGRRNNSSTLPLILIADRAPSMAANSILYIASPVTNKQLNDVTISLTSTTTASLWFACGADGTIVHSAEYTGTGSPWTNVSIAPAITEDFNTIAARPSSSASSTIIVAGTNGVAYRATKSNVPAISAWSAIAGLPTGVTWDKVIPVKRTDTNVQWFLVGYYATGAPLIYYSTDDGVSWSEFADKTTNWGTKFKTWVHDPSGIFPLFCGIASVPSATLNPSSTNEGYKTLETMVLGGGDMWTTNTFPNDIILAKISDVETSYSSSILYASYFNSDDCTFANAKQLRPITGLLEPEGYYHKNIIPNNIVPFKHFFGFGNGITFQFGESPYGGFAADAKFPGALTIKSAPQNVSWDVYDGWEERGPEAVKIYGGLIRGWHYGLYNALPTFTKQITRRGKFGQLRDILEGRTTVAGLVESGFSPYTNLPIQRTLFFPVEISFTSGTLIYSQSRDYVTATNPTYNPYDSGIYDIYYRSGQPFFDRDNED
jgi:hypothetical protein